MSRSAAESASDAADWQNATHYIIETLFCFVASRPHQKSSSHTAIPPASRRLAESHEIRLGASARTTESDRPEAPPLMIRPCQCRGCIQQGYAIQRRLQLAGWAGGETVESLLEDYQFLEPEDIRACLLFAHRSLAGEHVHDRVAVRGARRIPALCGSSK